MESHAGQWRLVLRLAGQLELEQTHVRSIHRQDLADFWRKLLHHFYQLDVGVRHYLQHLPNPDPVRLASRPDLFEKTNASPDAIHHRFLRSGTALPSARLFRRPPSLLDNGL